MTKHSIPFLGRICLYFLSAIQLVAAPIVSNVQASQRAGTKVVDVVYDLSTGGESVSVWLEASTDGSTWERLSAVSGAVGAGQTSGTGRSAVWAAGDEWPAQLFPSVKVRVSAALAPEGYSLIPAGTFTMGSPQSEPGRFSNETQHSVTLTRSFYLQQTEVTKAQWDAVRAEGAARGYTDLPPGRNGYNGDASGRHPVTEVSWYDVVKWLNLKSELEGLTPCYTVSGSTYKTGQSSPVYDTSANGYRLPTEAEWEYACRAGTTTAFYTGAITHTDTSPLDPNLVRAGWYGGNSGFKTHRVGGKEANAWGLNDMHGNV